MGGAADKPLPRLGYYAVGLWLALVVVALLLALTGHYTAAAVLGFLLVVILGATLRGAWEGTLH